MPQQHASKPEQEPTRDVLRIRKFVGSAIARHRQNIDMTQEGLAERLGIGPEAVSRLERGIGSLTVERLVALAEIFDCRADELLLETSERLVDQSANFSRLLFGLSVRDRRYVIEDAERLANFLREKTYDTERSR